MIFNTVTVVRFCFGWKKSAKIDLQGEAVHSEGLNTKHGRILDGPHLFD